MARGKKLGCELHFRSSQHAQDTTSSEESMLAVISEHSVAKIADVLILIQPTSPLTKPEDFDLALELFEKENFDSLATGTLDHSFTWEVDEKGKGEPNYNPKSRPRRQEMINSRKENGAFYITKRQIWEEHKCRLGGNIGFYTMKPFQSIEIDTELDWELLEEYLKQKQIKKKQLL